jgi:hypothetical protein
MKASVRWWASAKDTQFVQIDTFLETLLLISSIILYTNIPFMAT